MGATWSRIFLQVSGSSSAILSLVIGGKEHKRQGSPTQRHPLHDACTKVANEHKKILDTNKINETEPEKSGSKFLDTLNLLQNKAVAIMNNHNLNYEQMAYTCAMATAFIVKECQHDLALESGYATAVYGFIEGCKTYPPEFSDSAAKKKSFFKFWK